MTRVIELEVSATYGLSVGAGQVVKPGVVLGWQRQGPVRCPAAGKVRAVEFLADRHSFRITLEVK